MYLAKQANSFSATITQEQIDVVNDFFVEPINWDEVKHGEKRKLDKNMSVVFLADKGTEEWKNTLEAHKKFYDLHCTMEGNDVIVSTPMVDCRNVKTEYNEEADYILFNEAPVQSMNVPSGSFCLIPPADAHMALYGNCGFVRKVVFKIPVSG